MNKNNLGREIVQVKFQNVDAVVPGLGILPGQLPSINKSHFKAVMHHGEHGIDVLLNGYELMVPWANVQYVMYKKV